MKIRCTMKGYIGLLVGLVGAAFYLLAPPATPPARGQESAKPPGRFAPTEQIDVEQPVDFPWDI